MQRPIKGEMVNMVFEWEPHTPRRMKPHELEEYREKRNRALAEVSELMGGSVLCVEV